VLSYVQATLIRSISPAMGGIVIVVVNGMILIKRCHHQRTPRRVT